MASSSNESGEEYAPHVVFTVNDAAGRPLVSYVRDSRTQTFAYVTQQDVAAGTTLVEELPADYVALFPASTANSRRARALLPAEPALAVTVEGLYAAAAAAAGDDTGAAFAKLPAVLEWLLVYRLLLAHPLDVVTRWASQMPQPGRFARSRMLTEELAAGQPLDDTMRAWLAFLLRMTRGRLALPELLHLFGSVCRNAMHVRSPLTQMPYALALFPSTAHVAHACQPTGHAVFDDGMLLRIVAASNLPAGTRVTLHRSSSMHEAAVRCLQTAPKWLRTVSEAVTGAWCQCDECIAALAWIGQATGVAKGQAIDEATAASAAAAVEQTWQGAAVPDTYPPQLRAVLTTRPLALHRINEAYGNTVLQLLMTTVTAMCTSDIATAELVTGPPLHTLSVCRALLAAALQDPASVLATYGPEAFHMLTMAAGHLIIGGAKTTATLLKQQGASPAVLRSSVATHEARASFLSFAGCASFLVAIDAAQRRAAAAAAASGDGTGQDEPAIAPGELQARLAKLLAMHGCPVLGMLRAAWTKTVIACQHPAIGQREVGAQAAAVAGDMIRLEATLFANLEPVIAALTAEDTHETEAEPVKQR